MFFFHSLQADKLIRDIKKYYEDGETSTFSERDVSESVSSAYNSGDDEIVFSFNPVTSMIDAEEEDKQIVDNEIVFMADPSEEDDENDKCNKSEELENIEEKLCEIDQENQNLTVEYEENQVSIHLFLLFILLMPWCHISVVTSHLLKAMSAWAQVKHGLPLTG